AGGPALEIPERSVSPHSSILSLPYSPGLEGPFSPISLNVDGAKASRHRRHDAKRAIPPSLCPPQPGLRGRGRASGAPSLWRGVVGGRKRPGRVRPAPRKGISLCRPEPDAASL